MKGTLLNICFFGLCVVLPVKVWSRNCPGGQQCAESHECCLQGCCLPRPPPHRPPVPLDTHYAFSGPMKYYLWMLMSLAAVVLALAWCCRVWPAGRWWRACCGCGRASRASEADSAGSCYYPPQYSRCGSLCRASVQPAPPPYNEVTSKPDLYPMVIYIGADKGDGDLMVQYFKNYIVRPAGSLSATSTADSLSSSYLCNTANEANTIIPPPYSCAGSLEWGGPPSAPAPPAQRQALLRSVSSLTCREYGDPGPRRALHLTESREPPCALPTTHRSHHSGHSAPVEMPSQESLANIQQVNRTMLAHSSSVPNGRLLYPTDIQSAGRVRSEELCKNMPTQHVIYLTEGYSTDYDLSPNVSNDQNNSYSSETNSPKVKVNDCDDESPGDFAGESNQSTKKTYARYAVQETYRVPDTPRHVTNEDVLENLYGRANSPLDTARIYIPDPKRRYETRRDQSLNDSDRNTSAFNLHSLEENQYYMYYPPSLFLGMNNHNTSSEFSNFTKNINNFGSKDEIHRTFSVGNSMTGSDISSLANLGTPDSPPQATSPTSELKELLDKIQQLPNRNDERNATMEGSENEESHFTSDVNNAKHFFCKSRKNSLYMPLNLAPKNNYPGKVSPTSNTCFKRQFARRSWLSRSAPTTPSSSGLVPNILTISQRNGATTSGRNSRISKGSQPDESPLLTEQDASGDEAE